MELKQDLLASLRATGAELFTREDNGFATAASIVYAGDRRTPAAIIRPTTRSQLAAALPRLVAAQVSLAVRGGGHSLARHSLSDGCVVIDMRGMKHLDIDASRRRAQAGAGLTAGEYTRAVAEYGLATGFGDSPDVGMAGLTLGGGIGYLSRRLGLTIDQLRGAEMVTLDGRIVQASADTNPELFFALRGGGGGFGVVTRLDFDLHEVSRVTGGVLAFRADTDAILAALAAADAAPDEISVMVNVMKAPPMPFLPEAVHGKPIIAILVCHSGDPAGAAAALAPFRAAGAALADTVSLMPYPQMFNESPDHTGLVPASSSFYFDTWTTSQAATAIKAVASADAPLALINLRPMGGAIARVPPDVTAFGQRQRAVMASAVAMSPDALDVAERQAWTRDLAAILGDPKAGGYLSFAAQATADEVQGAFSPDSWRRLRAVKEQYDPDGVLSANFSVAAH